MFMRSITDFIIKLLDSTLNNNRSMYFKKTTEILKSLIRVSIYFWILILVNETLLRKCMEIVFY